MKCEVCGKENPVFAWTDTHGVAQCYQCGTPYVLYPVAHEDTEVGKRAELLGAATVALLTPNA